MSEQMRIITTDREYELHVGVWSWSEGLGEHVYLGHAEYLWSADGTETNDPSEAVKVTIDGDIVILDRSSMLRVEVTENTLWPETESAAEKEAAR